MDFKHPKLSLDQLRPWLSLSGLDRNIHHLEHLIPRGHLQVERSHPLHQQIPLGNGSDKGGVLGLGPIQITISAKLKLVGHGL